MNLQRAGVWIGTTSLLLSAISFILSAAPFTPAVLLSLFTIPGAVLSAAWGARRLAAMTSYLILSAALISPIGERLFPNISPNKSILVLPTVAVVLALALIWNYRRSRKSWRSDDLGLRNDIK